MKLAVVILLAFSFNCAAGIRTIIGGGGEAEMRALGLFDRFQDYVTVALATPELCHLTAPQVEFLTKSLQRGWISTDGYRLEFFTPTGDPHQLYVASATLYAELDQPRPIGAIGGRVFAAWMERPIVQPLRAALHLDSQALVRLGEQVFSVLRIRAEKVRLAPSAALVALSILAQDKPVEVRWGLETAGGTNDVTAAILQKLRCETAGEPRITQVQGFANEAAAAVGRVQWSCGEGSYSGRLTIRLPSDGAPLEVTTGSFKALRSCGENLAIPQ